MNLYKRLTRPQLRKLLASLNDKAGHHRLWVDQDGEVHVDTIAETIPMSTWLNKRMAEAKYICETWPCRSGRVGPEAAENEALVEEVFQILLTMRKGLSACNRG